MRLLALGRSRACHNFITIDKLHYNVLTRRPHLHLAGVKCLKHNKPPGNITLFSVPQLQLSCLETRFTDRKQTQNCVVVF